MLEYALQTHSALQKCLLQAVAIWLFVREQHLSSRRSSLSRRGGDSLRRGGDLRAWRYRSPPRSESRRRPTSSSLSLRSRSERGRSLRSPGDGARASRFGSGGLGAPRAGGGEGLSCRVRFGGSGDGTRSCGGRFLSAAICDHNTPINICSVGSNPDDSVGGDLC